MNVTLLLDVLALVATAVGLVWGARIDSRRIGKAGKALLLMTLALYLFLGLSNVAEHGGLTAALDPYEDYAEILFFPFAFFLLYSVAAHLQSLRRVEAERRLRERERVLSTMLTNLPGMAYRCRSDPQRPMRFVSEGCLALTGYSPGAIVRDLPGGYASLIADEDRARLWNEIQAALAANRPFRLEYRIRNARGQTRWVLELGVGVRDDSGHLVALEGFVSDITERKQAEEDVQHYREHLESLVEERTSELQTARLFLERSLASLRADEEAGKRIQFKLLPSETGSLEGYRFSRNLIPSMYLSGDFVDYFAIDERHVGFYMADVSGHGVSSAFITVFLRSLVRSHQESFRNAGDPTILDPGMLLSKVNQELLRENLEKHVTIFYGVLDRTRDSLTYANAGQFPFPILWDRGVPELLDGGTLPVGLFPDAAYASHARTLRGTFVLFLFSDGLLEVLPPGSIASKVAFLAAQGAEDDFDVNKLVRSLGLTDLHSFPDDVAFLVVRSQA